MKPLGLSLKTVQGFDVPSAAAQAPLPGWIKQLVFNLMTLGLYNAYQACLKERKVKQIDLNKHQMEKEALALGKVWDDFIVLSNKDHLNDAQIDSLEANRKKAFESLNLEIPSQPNGKMMLQVVTRWVLNIAAQDLLGFIHNRRLDQTIQEECTTNQKALHEFNQGLEKKAGLYDKRIIFLKALTEVRELKKQQMLNPKGQALAKLNAAQQKLDELSATIPSYLTTDSAAKVSKVINEMSAQKMQLQDAKTLQEESINMLLFSENELQNDLLALQGKKAQVAEIEGKVNSLKDHHDKHADMIKSHAELGVIAPVYKLPAQNQGFFSKIISKFFNYVFGSDSDYDKRLNNKLKASEILETSFKNCFDELESMPNVIFNKSDKIYQDVDYAGNMNALYNYMAFHLINQSHLKENIPSYLKLNHEDLRMGSSKPEMTLNNKANIIAYNHVDEFTPLNNPDLMMGIDPVMAKKIMMSLDKKEKQHLFTMLLSALMPDDCRDLAETKKYMSKETAKVKAIREAAYLIKNIAKAFSKRYQELFNKLWSEYASDETEGLYPLKKTVQADFAPGPFVEWKLNEKYFSQSPNLLKALKNARENYTAVYDGMTKDCVAFPADKAFNINNLTDLAKQNNYSHYLKGTYGCLLNNLLAILVANDAQISSANIAEMKRAMAVFLDDAENAKQFQEAILSSHGPHRNNLNFVPTQEHYNSGIENYKKWLRQEPGGYDIDKLDLGQLEIEVCARMAGVRIGLFRSGGKTVLDKETGLVQPMLYVGPNTKESLNIFNMANSSFYGVFPKLKFKEFNNPDDKIKMMLLFWSSHWG